MVTGILIPADAEQRLEKRDLASLEDYHAAVGGWIEAVDLPEFGVTIYVNEEGRVRQLPFNSRASFLWWYHVPEARQKAMLAGDALVVGYPNSHGDTTELSATVRTLLLTPSEFRVEVRLTGEHEWHNNPATYPDYWEAMVWAMVLLERLPGIQDVRVVPVEEISDTRGVA